MLVHGTEFVRRMRAIEQSYRDNSRELTLEEWVSRPRREKVFDSVARLTSSLQ